MHLYDINDVAPSLRFVFTELTQTPAGDVWWLDASGASSQGLAYVNSEGNAIIKVDNTSFVPLNQKRNSVRSYQPHFSVLELSVRSA